MNYQSPESLYELLPAVYRVRDAQQGYPLRDLLSLVSTQAGIVKQDIDQLWDNFFIETCDEWVLGIGRVVDIHPHHALDDALEVYLFAQTSAR